MQELGKSWECKYTINLPLINHLKLKTILSLEVKIG